jgi:hypothetical protein
MSLFMQSAAAFRAVFRSCRLPHADVSKYQHAIAARGTSSNRYSSVKTAQSQRLAQSLPISLVLKKGDLRMSTTDHSKTAGKSGQRNRKAPQRAQKPEPQPTSKTEPKAARAQAAAVAPATKPASNGTAAPVDASRNGAAAPVKAAPVSAVASANPAPIGTAKPADTAPVSLQTIASAYSDCTKRSLGEIRSFVEKLTGARSLDKAIEIQNEFAKQSFQTFVADSQKIFGLYGEFAKQTFKPFAGFMAKATQAAR